MSVNETCLQKHYLIMMVLNQTNIYILKIDRLCNTRAPNNSLSRDLKLCEFLPQMSLAKQNVLSERPEHVIIHYNQAMTRNERVETIKTRDGEMSAVQTSYCVDRGG